MPCAKAAKTAVLELTMSVMLNIIKQAVQSATLSAAKSLKGRTARSSGYAAEDAAATWLQAQGLRIVERNVRYTFGEIDIVAWEGEGDQAVLVLFEVRLRKNTRFGDAASSITPTKQRRLWAAGQAYAARFKHPPPMRIDVLAYSGAVGAQGVPLEPLWIKNALG
jgi:putative endonuclease